MPVTPLELEARQRRITALLVMLRSLNVETLEFKVTLMPGPPADVSIDHWRGLDSREGMVRFASLSLSTYRKELCYRVREEHDTVFGTWRWYTRTDTVERMPQSGG